VDVGADAGAPGGGSCELAAADLGVAMRRMGIPGTLSLPEVPIPSVAIARRCPPPPPITLLTYCLPSGLATSLGS